MRKTLLLLSFILSFQLYSQHSVKGIIINTTTNLPIENVTISDTKNNTTTYSDADGKFTIESSGQLNFSKDGYAEIDMIIDKKNYNTDNLLTITLTPITDLVEVLIEDYSRPHRYLEETKSVSYISTNDINKANAVELHPILNRIPGVFMQNGTLNTNRITIRGIGARNLFGTANIKAYFGEIPLTDGNGESSIEDLELASLSHIEIEKGPLSSSFGVSLGGTIILQPEYNFSKSTTAHLSSTFGSYGLRRLLAKTSVGKENASLNIIFSNTSSDGYRDNNEYNRNTVTLTSSIDFGDKDNISIFGSYIDLEAGIPSSLDLEDFNNSPRQAAFTWGRSQAFEDVNYAIAGITWKHKFNTNTSLHNSVFGSLRNNDEPRPFNILNEESSTIGIRSKILGTTKLVKMPLSWLVGAELYYDNYNGETFENLYEDFPVGTGSVQGDQLSDLNEKRYYYNLFAEGNYKINEKLYVDLGFNLNQTFFDIEDKFLSDGEDSSGDFEFDPIFSPKIGANYSINPSVTVYGNIAHGFSTPTTSETLLPDGLFNPDIKPEIGWNYELGTRFSTFNDLLYGSVSVYTLRVKDLLVSRRTIDDNFFAINAGKTTHNGLEFDLNFDIIKKKTRVVKAFFNTSIYDHEFDEFIDLDNDFSGNDLTGVPSHVINLGVDVSVNKGFFGNLNFQHVGEIPANDANTAFGEAYELLHAKIGYKNQIGNHLVFDITFGANNILDIDYASQLQINARGFGGNAPRYFYPGLPFNVYGGININYRL
ncbi:TonB-dependent receptor [Aquimarina sp. D1M17]|uniref:TonB-dependent receptor domain-containing protein n=1 Tax=Aquimarina acroporae TaxID=2937283 RepID=UPI0020C07AB1|nr:TonB-dependent receptor [Aquimarina acroporae]MCK8522821.1 TonB-dependent receptor [Aquimarina acroporae]